MIYLDIKKAFNSISHTKLLHKLNYIGVSQSLQQWICNYLKNRRQRVKVGSSYSRWANVTSGVPQGSIIGPTLFLIFIGDLPSVVTFSKISMFADDTKIYLSLPKNVAPLNLQLDIDAILEWMLRWQVDLSVHKCSVLHIGGGNPASAYTMGNERLAPVTSQKDLGVLIDQRLNFHGHVDAICKKGSSVAALIISKFSSPDNKVLCDIFCSYARPHLEYSSEAWNPCYIGDIEKIERVQRQFTKRLVGLDSISYENRLGILKLDSLEFRRLYKDLVLVYKILHGLSILQPDHFFELKNSVTRGHSWTIRPKRCNLTSTKHSFANRIVNIWNILPKGVVSAKNEFVFRELLHKNKNLCRNFLVLKYF